VIIRQRNHGTRHAINPLNFPLSTVEQVITPQFFIEGQNPDQKNLAQIRVFKSGVVQRLGIRFYRVCINALPGGSIVFYLEGNITPQVIHKQGVGNVQVRRTTLNLQITTNAFPGKAETFRKSKIPLPPIVDIAANIAARCQFPAENPQVIQLVADAKRHQQHTFEDDQLRQGSGVVVLLQLPEVGGKPGVLQEGALNSSFGHFKAIVTVVQVIQAKDIVYFQGFTQPQLQVKAKQKLIAKAHHITSYGIIFGSYPGAPKHIHAGTAENLFAGLIQPGHLLPKLPALLFQATLNDLKSRTFLDNIFKAGAVGRHTKLS